jgi:predicted secreted hydrolase
VRGEQLDMSPSSRPSPLKGEGERHKLFVIFETAIFVGFVFLWASGVTRAWATQDGFISARPGYAWKFPSDHGNHPSYRTEWWYYTGHLKTSDGKRYGFELAFFRQALSRQVDNPSSFTARDLYFAHFALSDLTAKQFWFAEKLNRPGPGLAGAKLGGVDVWNENWQAFHEAPGHHLIAQDGSHSIDLRLASPFPPTLQGKGGYSVKGPGPGNASLYYSFPLMTVTGNLGINGKIQPVSGQVWMDHEFFSGGLSPEETGWDWFGLQMSDGTELMLYRLRLKAGGLSPASSGTFIDRSGKATHLQAEDFRAQALESWKSPSTGVVYPTRWLVQIPKLQLSFEVGADFPGQELDTAASTRVLYWEGSVSLEGKRALKPVKGEGYMELTGYDGKASGF